MAAFALEGDWAQCRAAYGCQGALKMVTPFILGISVLLQFIAAFMALRLIAVTGKSRAWIMVAAAISLMALRRLITLYGMLSGSPTDSTPLIAEIVALVSSAFMVAGVAWIGPVLTATRASEEALRKAMKRYHSTLDNMLEGCQIIGFDWRYLYVNDAVAGHGRQAKEKLLGHTMMECYPGIENTDMFAALRRCMDERVPSHMENLFVYPDGTTGWFELSIQPADEGIFILSIDITERKRAEEALLYFASIVESSNDAIIGKTLDGTIVSWNAGAEEIYGYSAQEVEGRSLSVLFPPDRQDELSQILEGVRRGKRITSFETKRIRKDGTVIDVSLTVSPIRNADGNLIGASTITRDTTKLKRAEEALRESEERYRSLYENTTIGLYRTTPDGRVLMANPALIYMLGFETFEELARRNLAEEGFEPEYPRRGFQQQIEHDGEIRGLESAWKRKDGSKVFLRESARLVRDESGKPIYYEGAVEDVTERRRAEEAQRRSEQLLRTVIDATPDWIFAKDRTFHYVLANKSFASAIGTEMEHMIGKNDLELGFPEELVFGDPERGIAGFRADDRAVIEQGKTLHNPYDPATTATGEEIIFDTYKTPLRDDKGETWAVLGFARDVTERRRAEGQLRRSEASLKEAQRVARVGNWTWDIKANRLEGSDETYRILGIEKEGFSGAIEDVVAIIHPDDRPALEQRILSVVNEKKTAPLEYRVIWPDQSVHAVWTEAGELELDEEGNPAIFSGIVQDITKRKQAEAALRESEERYRGLFDGIPIGLYRTTPEGRIVDANPTLVAMLGYSDLSELLAAPVTAVYVDAMLRGRFQGLLARDGAVRGSQMQLRRQDGAIIWVEDNAYAVRDSEGQVSYYEGSLEDITARKRAEESLEKRVVQLALVNDVAREVTASLDLEPLLASSARLIQETYGYPHVAIFLVEEGGELAMRGRAGAYADRFPPDHRLKSGQGIVGWVAQEGKPLCVNDVSNDPRYYTSFSDQVIRSELSTPLKVGAQILGVLDVQSDELDTFDEIDIVVLSTLADQMATAILNANLFEQAQMRLLYLASLNHASERVTRYSLDLEGVSQAIVTGLTEEVGVALARLWVVDQEGQELVLQASAGLYTSTEGEHSRLLISDCPGEIGQIAREQKPLLTNHVQEEDSFDREWAREKGIVSFAGYPLVKDGRLAAILAVFHIRPLEGAVLDVMGSFANQAAIALENARLYQELANYNTTLEQAVHAATAEVRHAKDRLETILNSSPDAILLLTPEGKIETANPAFYTLFGFDVDELFGRTPSFLVSPGDEESLGDYLAETVATGKTIRIDGQAMRKDESVFDAEVLLSPAKNEKVLGVVCSIRDITPLKEVERMKDAFVSNVSHELRTPITGLKLNHHLLGVDPENQEVYYGRLGREIDRLNMLIEDLLRLSRLDQGRVGLNLAPTDLNSVAAQYVGDRAPLAESRGLTLVHEAQSDMPEVECDSGLLGQVLSVLLTNAINYTPSGGAITVRTLLKRDKAFDWAGISVSDTGPGIDPDDLSHLFERFFRGKIGRESGAAGTGLGLAIAREIIERHKGRIEVASEGVPGKGAAFTLWLPAPSQEEGG
jgi:PAS domain S-box-containing protein